MAPLLVGNGCHCLTMEPPRGFEPRTPALRKRCSTVELRWLNGLATGDKPWQPALSGDKSTACAPALSTPSLPGVLATDDNGWRAGRAAR